MILTKKSEYEKYGFDLDCRISDKNKFVTILVHLIHQFIGKCFIVRLENDNVSWLPKWLVKKHNDYYEIKNYLDNITWKNKKYFGNFEINDIETFLLYFIEYPSKYEYQDIELYSIDSDYVLIISSHGNFWIINKDKKSLQEITKYADGEGATVVQSNNI